MVKQDIDKLLTVRFIEYHQISIAPEDKFKIAFVTNWGHLYGR